MRANVLSSRLVRVAFALVAVATLFFNGARRASAAATNLTWTGNGAAGVWHDANNWNGTDIPDGNTWQATIPNGTGNLTFNDPPAILNRLITGDGKVTFNSAATLTMQAGSSFTPSAAVVIGSGGFSSNGGLFWTNAGNTFATAGDFKASGFTWGGSGTITQTGGSFDVGNLVIPIQVNNFPIGDWQFAGTSQNTIAGGSTLNNILMTGSPFTVGATRLNWIVQAGSTTSVKWDLNGKTMTGNQVTVQGYGTPFTRHAYLHDSLGGTIDANNLNIATGNYMAAYLDLHNTNVVLRGSGTIYNNQSLNNAGTVVNVAVTNGGTVTPLGKFDITDNTTFVFDPAGGTANIDTGSRDLGLAGFTDNFAFHNVTIATGDTIGLIGDANLNPGNNNALYVGGTLRGEHNATLNLNMRNAYVDGALEMGNSAGKFTVNGGNLSLTSDATAHFEIAGLTPGTQHDQLVFSGAGTLSLNDAELDLDFIGTLTPGTYFLIDNQTDNAIDGTFALLSQGAFLDMGSPAILAQISYQGNIATGAFLGGNDFVLTIGIVPEPATAWMLALGACALVQHRRRNRPAAR